ncbi:hypothetical protein WA158_001655 [Blastocystis sp. Blastoise]
MTRNWVWTYHDEETDENETFEIVSDSIVKFKVTGIRFNKLEKDILTVSESVNPVNDSEQKDQRSRTQSIDVQGPEIKLNRSSSIDVRDILGVVPVPMTIIGDISDDGLGLLSWWEESTEME